MDAFQYPAGLLFIRPAVKKEAQDDHGDRSTLEN